jgi:hypothetical protein
VTEDPRADRIAGVIGHASGTVFTRDGDTAWRCTGAVLLGMVARLQTLALPLTAFDVLLYRPDFKEGVCDEDT